jgi:hypothetical protein
MHILLLVPFMLLCVSGLGADRFLLETEINGQHTKLLFDSGSEDICLWRQSAQRLHVKYSHPAAGAILEPGQVAAGITEICKIRLAGEERKVRFRVLDYPGVFDGSSDGVVGWHNLQKNIIRLDALHGKMSFLEKVPKEALSWAQFSVNTNSKVLELNLSENVRDNGAIIVDTGSENGLSLSPEAWKKWKNDHRTQLRTLTPFFTAGDGLVVNEEGWADRFDIGNTEVTDVPIMMATETERALGHKQFMCSLGLAALRRVDFVVDGNIGRAYLHSRKDKATPYPHNRAGAMFVPDPLQTNEFVARVIYGGPAFEAGVREGDVLLSIDGINISRSTASELKRFWMAGGTTIVLRIKRDGTPLFATMKLRDILGAQSAAFGRQDTGKKH